MSTESSQLSLHQARFDRASALMAQRDFRAAADILQELLTQRPLLMPARFNLGLCQYMLGEYAEACPNLLACYQAGDRSAGLLRVLISTQHHLGLVDEAVAIADQNPEPARADAGAAGVYALLYLDAGLSAKAQQWAARTLKANPGSVDGMVVQATLRMAAMDTQGAQKQFEEVLLVAPANARAWIGIGTLALLEQDFERAKTQLTRGVELMPGHVGSWHILGWTHLLSSDLQAAEAAFQRALALDRNFAETHGGLASIAALRGERAAAEQAIDIALRLDKDSLAAKFAQSVLMGAAGNSQAGRQLIRDTVMRLSPKDGGRLSRVIEGAVRR